MKFTSLEKLFMFVVAAVIIYVLITYFVNQPKVVEKPVEKKEEEKPVEPEPVEEIPMPVEVEAYMVEPYENKFTSDVRDVNNQNYMSYVFGGKLEK